MAQDELSQYLDALSREASYSVDSVLKESDFECTEIVYFTMPNNLQSGPFIRKTIRDDAGLGQAYERIFRMQQADPEQHFAHIPRLHECYKRDANLVVVMEYIMGETLQDLVYRSDPSLKLVAEVFPKICDAVSELHESFTPPLIHRDLKPSNVMVTKNNVYIIDFGIARDFKDEASADTMHFGTRAYAPPEQFGYGQTTVRSDVYALGMLLYFCLVEETPTAKVLEEGFADARIPEQLRNILVRATAFDPQNRYESARELKAAAEHALMGLGYGTQLSGIGGAQAEPKAWERRNTLDGNGVHETTGSAGTEPASTNAVGYPASTNAVGYPAPADARPKPVRPAEPGPLRKTVGIIWNMLVAFVVVVIVVASIFNVFNAPVGMEKYPRWFNTLGYAFLIPALVVFYGFILMDKTPFKKRFPNTIGTWTLRHYIIAGLGVTLVAIIILMVMAAIASLV